MARDWPAKDMAPLIELIADPRHRLNADGTYRLSEEQAKAILDLRLARLTALGRDEIGDELKKLGDGDQGLPGDPVVARAHRRHHQAANSPTSRRSSRRRARPRSSTSRARSRTRTSSSARTSSSPSATRATSSACRSRPTGRSGAAARAARAWRRATRISSRRCSSTSTHTPVLFFSSRGMCYRMKVWRLPAATPQSPGKALVNLLPLEAGRGHHVDPAAARGRRDVGAARAHVRDALRQHPPQRADRLREHQSQRQDRDEARRGRPASSPWRSRGPTTTCC